MDISKKDRKSTAIWDIVYFVRDKVITMDAPEGFSLDFASCLIYYTRKKVTYEYNYWR